MHELITKLRLLAQLEGCTLTKDGALAAVRAANELEILTKELADLRETAEAAIEAGDWKVDGACDPDPYLIDVDYYDLPGDLSGWDEKRIDIIGQNGPTGEHYEDDSGC